MKADLAIYTHVFGVPGQWESVALMLSHKMDFNCCANRDGFCIDSHIWRQIQPRAVREVIVKLHHEEDIFVITRGQGGAEAEV